MTRLVALAVSLPLAAACGERVPPRSPETPPATSTPDGRDDAPSAVAARIGELFERGLHTGDEVALAEAFRSMRDVARPEELPLVDRLERLVRDLHPVRDLEGLVRVTAAALADLERLAPNADARLAVAQQAVALAIVAAGEPSGTTADRLAIGISERLVRDQPHDPRAWEVRAQVLRRIEEDLRGAAAAARRCSAEHPPCAELAWQLVREIEAPRCPGAHLRPGFALHRGNREGEHPAAPRAIQAGGPMWIAAEPALAAADVASIAADGGTLLVTLTPAAAAKLEPFRSQAARVDAAGAVLVDGTVVGAAARLVPMMRGKLLVDSDPAAPLSLDAVCAKIVRDRAPG